MDIAAILPCYKVKAQIQGVIASLPKNIHIICVDDCCPEGSGAYVESLNLPNVTVIKNPVNLGVGGAVKAGYAYALKSTDARVFVKVDGDGQMPGDKVEALCKSVLDGSANYAKGNRFYYLRNLKGMPVKRLFGNTVLSFFTKLSSGYWDVMDPTNGFTAISREALLELDLDEIDNRYFFESDMLCRLYFIGAIVKDFPMKAVYGDEQSSLRPLMVVVPFLRKNLRNLLRRIVYTYFIRDFNAGSLALLASFIFGTVGLIYGVSNWFETLATGQARAGGVVMLAALSLMFSLQFLLFFFTVDMQNNPNQRRR